METLKLALWILRLSMKLDQNGQYVSREKALFNFNPSPESLKGPIPFELTTKYPLGANKACPSHSRELAYKSDAIRQQQASSFNLAQPVDDPTTPLLEDRQELKSPRRNVPKAICTGKVYYILRCSCNAADVNAANL